MIENTKRLTVHLHGTLSANAQGVVPMWSERGGTLLEVAAAAANASAAKLQLGKAADADAIMLPAEIGQSGEPVIFTVADFDGISADPLGTTAPRFLPGTALTWLLLFDGGTTGGTNEEQSVTVTGAPTGGTFTLTWSGQTTGAIDFDATAAEVEAALVALSNIADGDVSVTGEDGGPWTVEFTGTKGSTNVAEMTTTPSLTGGTDPDVEIATATAGAAGTAAANVDIVFTILIGGVASGVSGL